MPFSTTCFSPCITPNIIQSSCTWSQLYLKFVERGESVICLQNFYLRIKYCCCCCCCCWVASVMSDSVQPQRRQPTRLPRPWDSPGKNTGVGCHFLLQCMKVRSESEVALSCPTLRDPMDCSPPGSSIHGIFQARVLEWGAIALLDILILQTLPCCWIALCYFFLLDISLCYIEWSKSETERQISLICGI